MFDKDRYEVIAVEKRSIPEGGKLVEAYETATEIIVCGYPPDEDDYPPGTPEEYMHDCDAMGCTSVSHVIYRFSKCGY